MAMVLKNGQMVPVTKASTKMVKSMEKESSSGQMEAPSMETFTIIIFRGEASMSGQMGESLMGSGRTTRCRDMAPSPGLMAGSMWASTMTI